MVWDAVKAVLSGKIIAKLALQKRLRQEKLDKLEKQLGELARPHKKDTQLDITQKIREIKNQIKEIYKMDIQKKLTFLKQRYYEVGSKSAKNLAYKLRKQQAERVVHKIQNLIAKQVKPDQNRVLMANVSMGGLQKAISRLNPNKSPGSDAFTAEWYKTFCDSLSPVLLRTFNWVLEKGEIPPSWREAIIAVIPKEGKDKTDKIQLVS